MRHSSATASPILTRVLRIGDGYSRARATESTSTFSFTCQSPTMQKCQYQLHLLRILTCIAGNKAAKQTTLVLHPSILVPAQFLMCWVNALKHLTTHTTLVSLPRCAYSRSSLKCTSLSPFPATISSSGNMYLLFRSGAYFTDMLAALSCRTHPLHRPRC